MLIGCSTWLKLLYFTRVKLASLYCIMFTWRTELNLYIFHRVSLVPLRCPASRRMLPCLPKRSWLHLTVKLRSACSWCLAPPLCPPTYWRMCSGRFPKEAANHFSSLRLNNCALHILKKPALCIYVGVRPNGKNNGPLTRRSKVQLIWIF